MTKEGLKQEVADFIEIERRSCSMDLMIPVYVARCLQISIEDAAWALNELQK